MTDPMSELLGLLVCPVCQATLTWDYEAGELICTHPECGLAYPVREGIPSFLIDEARPTIEP
ncbi:MAG: Trm112 family protein [Propioniciclava sp.]